MEEGLKSDLTQLLLQGSNYRQGNNCSKQFHRPLRSWWMGWKKKPSTFCLGNLIYEYGAIIVHSRAEEKAESSLQPACLREIFLFQLRLKSWWFPQVNCGLWLAARSSTVAALCQLFHLTACVDVCVESPAYTEKWRLFLCQEKSSSHWKRIAF